VGFLPRPHHLRAGLLAAVLVTVAALAPACKKSSDDGVLQPQDLTVATGVTFDPGEIVASASFTDSTSLAEGPLALFLGATPYGNASFLSTYQSDGMSAVDAVIAAGAAYRINPLVFLVKAQVAQGLIGMTTYPTDASRVEYVFGCGCFGAGQCDSTFAGFDKQVDCYGQQLRAALDAIASSGRTAGGWGPMVQSTSADGVAVTPADDSTAALYDNDPVVGAGSTGNWLFWNVWNEYATALGYDSATPPAATGWVGDACYSAEGCSFSSAVCARGGYPGGMCTRECASNDDCPVDPTQGKNFCATFAQQTGYCVLSCNGTTTTCRDGYKCSGVLPFGADGGSKNACIPGD
jgi:hypothetical protein